MASVPALRTTAIVLASSLFLVTSPARANDCDGFAGPFDSCPSSFPPYASIVGSSYYGPGPGPFFDNYFPLIQVCFGPECPPCLFGNLDLQIQIYPRVASDFICDLDYFGAPVGTTYQPPAVVPSGACPILQTISFPDQLVVCPGFKTVEVVIETDSEPIDQSTPGGGSRALRSFGYDLVCVKSVEQALARSRGVIPIVFPPWAEPFPTEFWFPFAVANLSALPHEVLISFETTAGWNVTTPPPASVLLAGGESANLLIGFEVPPGALEGASNTVTVAAELAGVPGSLSTSVTQLVVESGASPVPILVGPGVVAGASGLLASGWLAVHRLRKRPTRGLR